MLLVHDAGQAADELRQRHEVHGFDSVTTHQPHLEALGEGYAGASARSAAPVPLGSTLELCSVRVQRPAVGCQGHQPLGSPRMLEQTSDVLPGGYGVPQLATAAVNSFSDFANRACLAALLLSCPKLGGCALVSSGVRPLANTPAQLFDPAGASANAVPAPILNVSDMISSLAAGERNASFSLWLLTTVVAAIQARTHAFQGGELKGSGALQVTSALPLRVRADRGGASGVAPPEPLRGRPR